MSMPESSENSTKVYEEFDETLWKAGVAAGAFAGLRDPGARWFTLESDGKKCALASAVPGPGDLTSVSYYVLNDERGKGYATVLASNVCDRFEKASFLVMKENTPSVKVALNALRDRFSMTLGHNVVRLTKEAADERNTVGTTLEGRIHESFTVAADKMYQAGLMSTKERIGLSGAIGEMLGKFRKSIDKDVASRTMTDRAHELLKKAIDPVAAGLGAVSAGTSVVFGVREMFARKALQESLRREAKLQRLILAALGASAIGGAAGGYLAGRHAERKKKELALVLPWSSVKSGSDERTKSIEAARERLKGLVAPMKPIYKTKSARGWDVMVESMLGDTSATGVGT
jgi:hypothetical protein